MPAPARLAFDDVVVDFTGQRLLRGGVEQALEPKAFAVLALLAGSPGRVFGRDELLDAVWGHQHVSPGVLSRSINLLRQALGEDAHHPRLLHTVHGVGYRFDPPPLAMAGAETTTVDGSGPGRQPVASPAVSTDRQPDRGRWLWPATAGAALLVAIAIAWPRQGEIEAVQAITAASVEARPSVAVLPFADLSRTRDQEYLADGLTEEIINQLAQLPALRVVGRTSSFSFKGESDDLREIGHALGVAHLLKGSVRRDGDQLRITAQLVRADDGSHVWSRTYARELRDVFAIQDEIASGVATALSVKLDVVAFNRGQGGTTHVGAYERLLRWRSTVMREHFDFQHDRERLQLAREMVALDPQCVLCWDALARSLDAMAGEIGGSQQAKLRSEATHAREHIARIAPDSWVAKRYRSRGLWQNGKWAQAMALAKQTADSGPPTMERTWDYSYMIFAVGYLDENVALVERVRASEPLALYLSRDLQFDYIAARRFADAEAEYLRGRSLEGSQLVPDYIAFYRQLAGKRPGGLSELRELHRRLLRGDARYDTPAFRDLGKVLDDRRAMLDVTRKALADHAYRHGDETVGIWAAAADALGDADLAALGLRKELEHMPGFREGTLTHFDYNVFWILPYSDVRSHPEFKRLLVETGVVGYWRETGQWGDGCGPLGTADFHCE
ncbi:winged helix-turn-helix domain-containing protein [Luteimonas vadosa]|uniref:OmpR/PhoB-type domain-containing protein n=1 Tax=Luteimonas vadosa TaxID=1165507 RepID=A0ABP9DRI1_9GAMM